MQNQYGNQGYNQQPQGGYGQAPQGGFQPQGGQQGQGGQRNSGFDNHVKIQVIGRLVKDPESKIVGNSKVASAKIAINHRSEKAGTDFWFVEVWGNEGADSKHNFLVNHCPKGRRVFVEGTPELRQTKNQDGSYNYFPTIKATDIIGLDGGNQGQGGGQQQQPQGNFNQQPQGNFNQQPQGGFQQPQGNFGQPQGQPYGAPQQGNFGQPQGAPQGQPQQGGFPPNPPGAQYGAPVGAPVGAPAGAPGGFPPTPPQQ